ncbi:uncharacterized protein LOC117326491 [Pecten maximus]|uniref:uncharacterized protein LOC117326491 n=1 Tax=Pecten maximus TaxID=6579 RepID=UPI001458264F|nr:uncharacterized protein LOC117326491 [Pecten maximus]
MSNISSTTQLPISTDNTADVLFGYLLWIVLLVTVIGVIVSVLILSRKNNSVSDLSYDDLQENTTEDIFGKSWDFETSLSSMDGPVDINDTGVRLNFKNYGQNPEEESKLYLHCSVHDNFKLLASKLNVNNDQMLVSPAVELTLLSKQYLNGYMVIEIPVCKLKTFESLRVHWIATPLTSSLTKKDIPFQKDPASSALDCYYTWSDNGTVLVYTNHFCLFFCSCFRSDIRFELSAQICARVGQIDGFPTLKVKFIFLGIQNRLKNRQEDELESDIKNGFHVIEYGEIKLLEKQNSKKKRGFLRCSIDILMGDNCPKWEHVKRKRNQSSIYRVVQEGDQCPIYQAVQDVDVAELMKRWHREHELCHCMTWYMKCEKRYSHRLPIVVDVTHSSHDGKRHLDTTFTMEVDITTGPDKVHDHNDVSGDRLLKPPHESRESEEVDSEHPYDMIPIIPTETALSHQLPTRTNKGRAETGVRNNTGFLYIETEQESQRNTPDMTYDCPDYMSTGSNYASMNAPVNGLNRSKGITSVSPYASANVSDRSRRQHSRHSNNILVNNSSSNKQAGGSRDHNGSRGTSSSPIINSETTDRHLHDPNDRPPTIGASNDPDETMKKQIVDDEQTIANSTVSDSLTNGNNETITFV